MLSPASVVFAGRMVSELMLLQASCVRDVQSEFIPPIAKTLLLARKIGGVVGGVAKAGEVVWVWGAATIPRHFGEPTPAMNDPTLPLPGLSPVSGKTVVA